MGKERLYKRWRVGEGTESTRLLIQTRRHAGATKDLVSPSPHPSQTLSIKRPQPSGRDTPGDHRLRKEMTLSGA